MKGKIIHNISKYNNIVEYKGNKYLTVRIGKEIQYIKIKKEEKVNEN